MEYNSDNKVVKLCAEGMNLEGEGKIEEAFRLFLSAWHIADSDFEKFVSAHYVARHQKTVSEKLVWDRKSLQHALKVDEEFTREAYPSLYLNIAKCYEDLGKFDKALEHYQLAEMSLKFLPDTGYGRMITQGIIRGIQRVRTGD